jgi:uncharacterized membrane protein
MKALRLTKAFSIWLAKAFIEKVIEQHHAFKEELRRHPPLAILLWVVLSIFWIAIFGFSGLTLFSSPLGFTFGWVSTILYLVYAIFSNLYALFKRDRKELFETIKNS